MYVYLHEGDIFLWKIWKTEKLRENIPSSDSSSFKEEYLLTDCNGWVPSETKNHYVTAFDCNFYYLLV